MPPRPFVNDALWRCLCPAFSANAPRLAVAREGTCSALSNKPRTRTLSYSREPTRGADAGFFAQPNAPPSFSARGLEPRRSHGEKPPLAQLPTHMLYEHMRDEGAKGHFEEVFNICRVLVKDRAEVPNKEMYTAVLHSFVSATNGTAGKVRKVLDEMGFWGAPDDAEGGKAKVELDARGCECVLEVLAVHPDYLLRTEMLEYMKARWFTLSDRGHNFVVAGLLRERHFEQALETLEAMVRRKTRIEGWLFDQALWVLLEFGEVDEAFHVLRLKAANATGAVRLSSALWGSLLDAAAQRQLVSAASPPLRLALTDDSTTPSVWCGTPRSSQAT
jgi:hypothetical protein